MTATVRRKAGRPTKRSVVVQKVLLTALRGGNTRATSAKLAGINYSTLKRWCALSAPFCAEIEKAEAQAEQKHVANIRKAGADGNWQASAWWLERRRNDDWRKPAERLEHSIDTPIRVGFVVAPDGGRDDEPDAE